jgi:hypothetical protein
MSIQSDWKNPLPESYIDYLNKRNVFNAPFINPDQDFFHIVESNQLVIPWYNDDGDIIYYQKRNMYKNPSMKYLFPKNMFKPIAGLDNIDISFKYIICFEGFFDSIFVKNGVCIGGKNLTNNQKKLIKDRYPYHKIVLAFDNDSAGMNAMLKEYNESSSNVSFLYWFDKSEFKDINDHIINTNDNIFDTPDKLLPMIISGAKLKLFLSKMRIKK